MSKPAVKEQILSAALEAIHERGYHATGVQEIADAAGVPKGSFYNHFESKDALGAAVMDRYWQLGGEWTKMLCDESVAPVERLRRYFFKLHELGRERGYERGCLFANLGGELGDNRLLRDRLSTLMAAWTRAVECCVKDGQADGSIRGDLDSGVLAGFLVNWWEGCVIRAKIDREAEPMEQFDRCFCTFLTARPAQAESDPSAKI